MGWSGHHEEFSQVLQPQRPLPVNTQLCRAHSHAARACHSGVLGTDVRARERAFHVVSCCRAFLPCMNAEERGAWLEATGEMEGCARGRLHSASSESRQERGLHKAPATGLLGTLAKDRRVPACVPGCTADCGCWSDSHRLRAGVVSGRGAWAQPAGHLGGRQLFWKQGPELRGLFAVGICLFH